MNTLTLFVKRHPLVTFFILTYALTWALVPLIGGVIPQMPLLAAVIVLAFSEGNAGLKALFRQATHWRVGWIWYLIAPGLIIFDRRLWFAPTSPAQPEVELKPAVGV